MYRSDARIGIAVTRCRHVSGRAGYGFLACGCMAAARVLLPVSLMFLLGACAAGVEAPVIDREPHREGRASVTYGSGQSDSSTSAYHRVSRGDTLYSIAWRYDLDYRNLAAWNGISKPYIIYPGQRLRLRAGSPDRTVRPPPGNRPSRPAPATPPAPGTARQANTGSIDWEWPTTGRLVSLNTPIAKKGVNITGSAGQPVKAAANGHVVYSGSGLLGYGKLIIIKHNDIYLSAYAHNNEIFVSEGDRVVVGQKIATMGLGGNGEPLLHFEIRKDGKPVSPLSHLPQSRS